MYNFADQFECNGFFVKFGGKFFSAHLANSVSAYIFL